MRILHVTDHYGPTLGGIETHVAALARRQAGLGHDVTVLTSSPARADGRTSTDTGPVRVRRARSLTDRTGTDPSAYDVVHAHLSVVAPFTAPLAASCARRGVPTVVTVHSLWNGTGPVPLLGVALTGLRTAPVRWTAVSRLAARQLADRLPPGTGVGVLPNAVDVRPRTHLPARSPGQEVELVSTMRIARRKRPRPLVSMFASLQDRVGVPLRLTIVGDGPQRRAVERDVAAARLDDRVRLTGRVAPEEVRRVLAGADVYVAPAVLESFGLAALEARCVGLPVVGRSDSGMTDFVRHGVEGLMTASDAQMVDALAALVGDRELRERISEHNRTTPSEMTWARGLLSHETAYAEARHRGWNPTSLSPAVGR